MVEKVFNTEHGSDCDSAVLSASKTRKDYKELLEAVLLEYIDMNTFIRYHICVSFLSVPAIKLYRHK